MRITRKMFCMNLVTIPNVATYQLTNTWHACAFYTSGHTQPGLRSAKLPLQSRGTLQEIRAEWIDTEEDIRPWQRLGSECTIPLIKRDKILALYSTATAKVPRIFWFPKFMPCYKNFMLLEPVLSQLNPGNIQYVQDIFFSKADPVTIRGGR